MSFLFRQWQFTGCDGVGQVVDGQVANVGQGPVQLGLDASQAVLVVNVQILFVLLLNTKQETNLKQFLNIIFQYESILGYGKSFKVWNLTAKINAERSCKN